ncbi:MAG: NTP transferase domain-containing protein [Flavobacteriaceae bacterium]|nr:NTP transferase domain-containing protein [Flavobacteriaceae bacterium]
MHNCLLILAGGDSSRMKKSISVDELSSEEIKQANTQSKALISHGSNNRPILDFLLLNAEKAGYKNIILIVGEQHDAFKMYYGKETANNTFNGLKISYAIQHIPEERKKPFGTADAVTQALEQYPHLQKESFTVCNCDNLYSVKALQEMATTIAQNAFISYDRDDLEFSMQRISRFALVLLDSENHVIDIIEKPSEENLESYRDALGKFRVSMNIFKLDGAQLFPYLKYCPPHPVRNEKELPTAILNFCKEHPSNFKGIPFYEHVPDLTSKEDIRIFKNFLHTHFKEN